MQTEVAGTDEQVIRTTILEGGAVCYSKTLPWPTHLEEIEDVLAFVKARHQEAIDVLTRAEQRG